MNKITFHSNRIYNNYLKNLEPDASKKHVPEWFSSSSRLWEDDFGNSADHPFGGKVLSFKACPALMDAFVMGYMLKTPCSIYIYKDYNQLKCKTDLGFEDFCGVRPKMQNFPVPQGYEEDHFHWYPNWMPSLPKGYSALYVNPLNRFDLPFLTVSGVIDNDDMDTPGLMPFFIKKGFEGVIPAGTIYAQIIPFKREDWEIEKVVHTQEAITERHQGQANKFRVPEGGAYKKTVWKRKSFS
jgi:hypothetical protein